MFNKSNFLNSLKTIKAWEASKIRKIVKKQDRLDNSDKSDKSEKLEKLFSFNDVIIPGLDPTCRNMFKIGNVVYLFDYNEQIITLGNPRQFKGV